MHVASADLFLNAKQNASLWMFEGKLSISVQTAKSVYNNQLLRCVIISASSCDFECYETQAKVTLPNDCVQRFLRSAKCMTFASCKGRSMEEVGIHTQSAKFSKRHLFVALSRARSSQKAMGSREVHAIFTQEFKRHLASF